MKYKKTDKGYIIRLFRGEKIVEELIKFCEAENIHGGWINGFGGVRFTEIGFFHAEKKEYEFTSFTNDLEIVSLIGNIALVDGKPFIHAHMVVSGERLQCFAGHLKEATVGPTCEIYLANFDQDLIRIYDSEIGLKLLDCTSK